MKPLPTGRLSNTRGPGWAGAWASVFPLLAISAAATVTYERKSEPLGIVSSQTVNKDINASVTTLTAPATSGSRVFSHWSLNGQRQADPGGIAKNPVTFTITENVVAIAHYLENDLDADTDGLPDWYEGRQLGHLGSNATADPDADGLTMEEEFRFDTPPTVKDVLSEGGVSRRRSQKIFINLGGAKKLIERSAPAGLLGSTVTHLENNTTQVTANLSGSVDGHRFAYWQQNGQRIADSTGVALSQVTVTMTEDITLVAKYFPEEEDTDADGLPDWKEWSLFGNLDANLQEDGDGDGFTMAEELRYGTPPRIRDELSEGGVSRRRYRKTFINLGGARKLTIQSDPPGIVSDSSSYLDVNSTYNSTNLNGLTNGYVFSHWEVNGVRRQDTKGIGLSQVVETMDQDKTIVAKYIEESLDSDNDGISDGYEMHEFGHLSNDGSADPDNDGFTVDEELRFGLSAQIRDDVDQGGVSRRRLGKAFVFSAFYPNADDDGDGLTNAQEIALGTNQQSADSDGDGFSDFLELSRGSDPLDANSLANYAPSDIHLDNNNTQENASVGSIVGHFSTTDQDSNSTHSYALAQGTGSTHNGNFSLDLNGTLRTAAPLDYEYLVDQNATQLSIRVRATDELNASMEKSFLISVTNVVEDLDGDGIEDAHDEDDDGDGFSDAAEISYGSDPRNNQSVANAPPSFGAANATLAMAENNASSLFVLAGDTDGNATLSYSLSGPDADKFIINAATGELSLKQPADHENPDDANGDGIYQVIITASDGHASATRNLSIAVTNVMEDLDGDGTEDAHDPDDDGDGLSDADEIAHGSDPRNPASRFNRPPSQLYLVSNGIKENRPAGSFVGKLHAVDPDANAAHVFTLADGNGSQHNHLFQLDANGSLRTDATFDFEAIASHLSIRAKASDEHNVSIEKAFDVYVTNVVEDLDGDGIEDAHDHDDDGDGVPDAEELAKGTDPRDHDAVPNLPPTAIILEGNQLSENRPAGSVVGQLRVSDPDDPEGSGTYQLEILGSEQNASLPFQVDSLGRLITMKPIDFEQGNHRQVTIKATDSGGLSHEANFTISVLNVQEPQIGSLQISENNGTYFATARTQAHALAPVTERGILVSNHRNPLPDQNGTRRLQASLQGTEFTVEVTGLVAGKRTYLRPYAISSEAIVFGSSRVIIPGNNSVKRANDLFADAPSLVGGWVDAGWLGKLYPTPRGWLYHEELGWLYPADDGENGLWLWQPEQGWLWTKVRVYPYLYQHRDDTWLYFLGKHGNKRSFYNSRSQKLEKQLIY